jgi:hypothetical protein
MTGTPCGPGPDPSRAQSHSGAPKPERPPPLLSDILHPRVIAEYVRTYHEERKRLSAKANAKQAHLELRLGEIQSRD